MTVPALVVHGGAGRLSAHKLTTAARKNFEAGICRSLKSGYRILERGGSAVDAVCKAVKVLEDDPVFNAGRGAVLCRDGSIELCASLMSGKTKAVGAVAGIRQFRNPIRGARALLTQKVGFLYGRFAEQMMIEKGMETVPPDSLKTPQRILQWKKYRSGKATFLDHYEGDGTTGTVGAVALDASGNLAAATSTGGLVNQLPGRIGDSPVIGSGTWADNAVCAISTTGQGDAIVRIAFARRVADLIELGGLSPEKAVRQTLQELSQVNGQGGCILISARGIIVMDFSSPQMIRGYLRQGESPRVAIRRGAAKPIPTA